MSIYRKLDPVLGQVTLGIRGADSCPVPGYPDLVIRTEEMPEHLNTHAALHGYNQKVGDAAALSKGSTDAEKYEAMKAVFEHLQAGGDWNRKGGGDGTSGDGLLVGAIMEFQNLSRDEARGLVAQMDKKLQAAMRASKELAPIIERLKVARAPKAPAGFDATAALAALMKPKTEGKPTEPAPF